MIDESPPQLDYMDKKLHALKVSLLTFRNQCTTIVLIHRLPNEVLVEILAWRVVIEERNISSLTFGSSDNKPPPFVLLRTIIGVCSRWQNAAIDQRHLWTAISIFGQNRELTTRLQIERAEELPIWIYFDAVSSSRRYDYDNFLRILFGIQNEFYRCTLLTIIANNNEHLYAILRELYRTTPVPPLKTLCIIHENLDIPVEPFLLAHLHSRQFLEGKEIGRAHV